MFQNLIKCDLSYFNQVNSGTLVSRFISDVGSISRGIHNVIINIIKDTLTFIFLVGVMFYHDPKLALISILIFPRNLSNKNWKRLCKISKNTQVGFGLLIQTVRVNKLSKTIKSFNKEEHEVIELIMKLKIF